MPGLPRKDSVVNAGRDAAICVAFTRNPARTDADVAKELGLSVPTVRHVRRSKLNVVRKTGGAHNPLGGKVQHVPRRSEGVRESIRGMFGPEEQSRLAKFNASRERRARRVLFRGVKSRSPRVADKAAKILERRFHCRVILPTEATS